MNVNAEKDPCPPPVFSIGDKKISTAATPALKVFTGLDAFALNAGLMKPRRRFTPVMRQKKWGGQVKRSRDQSPQKSERGRSGSSEDFP